MRKLSLFIILFGLALGLNAQTFGGNPPSINWRAIRTSPATIIYPAGSDSTANRIANLVNRINAVQDSSIGKHFRSLGILLQNQTTVSNGYVALAPFRSELMLTPPFNPFQLGSLAWTDQLILHEYRHIQQYSNFNRGGAKLFSILLGQQGQALANALTVPDWFFEGDAIFQETFLSRQGRGRMPSFYNGYRALWSDGTHYSYMKLRNGSLRHYVPDHYQLGYLLRSYGQRQYGTTFWKNVSEDAAAMKGLFYPLQKSIKRYSGHSFSNFTKEALNDSRWRLGIDSTVPENKPEAVVNEENPIFTENGELLFIRSSYKKIPAFYIRRDGSDKRIRVKDRTLDNYFSYSNGKIVYASFRPDTRWGWKDFSELQLLDVESGHQKRITVASKYFTPSLSKNADTVVAVHAGPDGNQFLHILSADGKLLYEVPNSEGLQFSFPYLRKGNLIVAARRENGEMALLETEIKTGASRQLISWSNHILGFPSGTGDTLLCTMAVDGQDRIVSLTMIDSSLLYYSYPSDSLKTGSYRPVQYKGKIVCSRFTSGGYKITQLNSSGLGWNEMTIAPGELLTDFGIGSINKGVDIIPGLHNDSLLKSGKYRKTTRLINFHSWQPYYEDPSFSFSVLGQNLLNTFQSELYFLYNRNEGYKQFGYTGTFGAWFPYITGGINYTIDRRGRYENRTIYWNEMELNTGFRIPLNFSRGRSITYLTAGSEIIFNKPYFNAPEKNELGNRSYSYLSHQLVFSHQVQQARQEIYPDWAQNIRAHYRHALSLFDSKQLLVTGNFYFPGIFNNHSLVLNASAQVRDSLNGVRFSDEMPFARGYETENLFRAIKWGVNYHFPLCYPDAGLWNIVYLLRMRSNIFYDHATAKDEQLFETSSNIRFRSAGTELFFDTRWWNQLPVSIGIRYARLLDPDIFGGSGRNRWQFILPVNLVQPSQQKMFNPAFR